MDPSIDAALSHGGVIDITTVGRRTGEPRRIEIVYHVIGGRIYITGMAGRPRSWLANMVAEPHFTFHLKRGVHADLPAIATTYDDDAARIWTEARDAHDLETRLLALPGIGPMKAKTIIAVLGKRFGIKPAGWDEVAPTHPTLGDVDSAEALARYQAGKRARKAALRAGASEAEAESAATEASERV